MNTSFAYANTSFADGLYVAEHDAFFPSMFSEISSYDFTYSSAQSSPISPKLCYRGLNEPIYDSRLAQESETYLPILSIGDKFQHSGHYRYLENLPGYSHHSPVNDLLSSEAATSHYQSYRQPTNSIFHDPHIMASLQCFHVMASEQKIPVANYSLPDGELLHCVYWNGEYYLSGTDAMKYLSFRVMEAGNVLIDEKKFEEGVFSHLRSVKTGYEALLEKSKSSFLRYLHDIGAVRTQKRQRVYLWRTFPWERLAHEIIQLTIQSPPSPQNPLRRRKSSFILA